MALKEEEEEAAETEEEEENKDDEKKEEKKQEEQKKRQRKGLAKASKRTRLRVARAGGNAYHNVPQGLGSFSGDPEKLRAIAIAGGLSRAKDRKGLSEAGKKGGERVKELYGGVTYFAEIGKKGGTTTSSNREFMAEIGKKGGGSKAVQVYGYEFLTEISHNRKKKKKKKKL